MTSDTDDSHDHDHDSHEHDDLDDHDHEHDHDDHGDEQNVGLAFAITFAAGFAACLGATSIFCVKPEQLGVVPAALGFSSGVVVYLSFMNLIPECIELLNESTGEESESLAHFYSLLCVIGGVVLAFLSERCFSHHHGDEDEFHSPKGHVADASGHCHADEDSKSSGQTKDALETGDEIEMNSINDQRPTPGHDLDSESTMYEETAKPENLSHLSYTIAAALILHHLPEGIATFISLYYDFEFGILVAFALVIHDVPSGVCIAVPTYCATGSMVKPFLLCLAAAAAYPIGGLIGWLVVEVASDAFIDSFIGALFGVTGGIMLYIAFVELLPTAIMTAKRYTSSSKGSESQYKRIYVMSIAGIFISTILLAEAGGHSH